MTKSIFENKLIYSRADGTFVVDGYHVCPKDVDPMGKYDIDELKSYLLDHPDAVHPEPLPPPPTDAQLESAAESQRQARFTEYDHSIDVLNNRRRRGSITEAEYDAGVAAWDAYAMALEAMNDTEGWFRAPEWPEKPEV